MLRIAALLALAFASLSAAADAGRATDEAIEAAAGAVEPVEPEPLPTIPLGEDPAPAPDVRPPPRSRLIEEIVVTAQKREESLQDVPLSVQAFTAETLSAMGIDDPQSLQRVTPGMQYSTQLGYSQIYIRGIGTDSFIPSSDATVATYIDGVYYPMAFGAAAEFGAIERVEVLKGPQGTLFGRNSTGGAINIVMKQPGDSPEGSVNVSRQSHADTRISGYASLPMRDGLAIALAARWTQNDSYYRPADDSPQPGVPGDRSSGYQLKLRWTPRDDVDASLGYGHVSEDSGTAGIGTNTAVRPLGRALLIEESPDYTTAQDHAGVGAFDTSVSTFNLRYDAPRFTTRLILAKIDNETYTDVDFDGSPRPIAVVTTPKPFYDSATAELQILSNENSWGSGWLTWIGGLYFIDSSVGFQPIRIGAGSDFLQFLAAQPPGGVGGFLPPLLALLEPRGALDRGLQANVFGSLDTRSSAAFAQGTAELTEWMALTLGGRYQTETRDLGPSETRIAIPGSNDASEGIPFSSFPPQRSDSSNFSPKAVLDFKLADDALVYLLYAKGYKSGTYNIVNIVQPAEYVKPEIVDSYELGYKDTLFDGSMRLSAAVFENRAENVQGQIISFLSGGLAALLNNGNSRIRGAEVEGAWQPLPNSLPGLALTGATSWLDGVYTSYPDGTGYDETTGLYFGRGSTQPGRDFSGNRTVRTPKWSGNLGLSYAFALGRGTAEIAGDAYYNSGIYYSAQNNAESREDSYTVVGARASYLFEPWNLRATAFGTNLTDARYYLFLADSDFATGGLLAPQAVYGLRLNWQF